MRQYYVYLATNRGHTVIYTGVTRDLPRRIWRHRSGAIDGFTKRYRVGKLVYFEVFRDSCSAILREKQIKAGSRAKKVALIVAKNPDWQDLWAAIR